ncbi:MAG: transcription termination/antitermination protein NusG [Oscillospiraceae bacterium]|nr:transcription termination/antitermination protein NusG [Oscillospiraceae bacterium]
MSEDAKWYVVHTYAGYEKKVADNIEKIKEAGALSDKIQEVRVLTTTVVEIKNSKEVEVERNLFPSYVFVKMEMSTDTWHGIQNLRGVISFVGVESKPRPLTDAEMRRFEVVKAEPRVELSFGTGDIVAVVGGALEGYEGVVESISHEKGSAKVLVNMFGRKTSVEIGFKDLASIADGN